MGTLVNRVENNMGFVYEWKTRRVMNGSEWPDRQRREGRRRGPTLRPCFTYQCRTGTLETENGFTETCYQNLVSKVFLFLKLSKVNKLSQHKATYHQRLMTGESCGTQTSSGMFPTSTRSNLFIHASNQSETLFFTVTIE